MDLILALYALAASAVFVGTYALGHYHGRVAASDRMFGPVAAGLVRVEHSLDDLERLADEPVPYLLTDPGVFVDNGDGSYSWRRKP